MTLSSSLLYSQGLSVEVQHYYVPPVDKTKLDTVCVLIYQLKNESSTSQVVMFTEDNVYSMPLKKIIKRKLYRRCRDFSLSQFVWDPNIVNHSEYVHVPDFFVKFLPPDESFNITLLLQNEDFDLVNSLFQNHVIVCNLEDIDNHEMFYGFKDSINYFNLEYPYSSITILWSQFANWLQRIKGTGT
jgi:hypothetical protein